MQIQGQDLRKALSRAIASADALERENPGIKDTVVQSVLLAYLLAEEQRRRLAAPEKQYSPELLNFLQQHGAKIQAHKKSLQKLIRQVPQVAGLLGAFNPDGTIGSAFFLDEGKKEESNDDIPSEYKALKDASHRIYEGVTFEEIQAYYHLGDQDDLWNRLLKNDSIFYSQGRFFLDSEILSGVNGYALVDKFLLELSQASSELITQKLQKQIQFVREKLREKARSLEEIPLQLYFVAPGGWIPLQALNEFPEVKQMGELYLASDGRIECKTIYSYYSSKEVVYLVNAINQERLTFDKKQEKDGVNSDKGKEWLGAFKERWKEWLLTSQYQPIIEEQFNRRYNGDLPRIYSDASFPIAKLTPPNGMRPHPYQWQDARSLLDTGKGILGLKVGWGKTLVAIMLVCALKELGRADKPMIITPKSLIGNWKAEIDRWTPSLNYLLVGLTQIFWDEHKKVPAREVPGYVTIRDKKGLPVFKDGCYQLKPIKKSGQITLMTTAEFDRRAELQFKEDSLEEKQEKLWQCANNDWDLILMWRETAKSIPLSPERELAYLEELAGRHLPKDENKKYFGDGKEKKTIEERRQELIGEIASKSYQEQEIFAKKTAAFNARRGEKWSPELIYFEQLGVDAIIRDEAHDCRNLWTPQGTYTSTKGANISPSQRAYDFYLKSRYIREKTGGNIFLLTATPVANTMLDLYCMMQYVCDEELVDRGIATIDNFIDVFGKVGDIVGPTMSGAIRADETLYGFCLLPELRSLFSKYAIIRDKGSISIKEPKENRIQHLVELTPEQSYLYRFLVNRMEEGLEIMRSGIAGRQLFKEHPELQPFSVLSDMDKLSLSLGHYLKNSIHGQRLEDLGDISARLADSCQFMKAPIGSYRLELDNLLREMAKTECERKGISVVTPNKDLEGLPWDSPEFLEIKERLKNEKAAEVKLGTLGDYSEKEFGWRCEPGVKKEILDVTYELNDAWEWVPVAGYPYHSVEMYDAIAGILSSRTRLIEVQMEGSEWAKTSPVVAFGQIENAQELYDAKVKECEQAIKDAEQALVLAKENTSIKPGVIAFHRGVEFVLSDDWSWQRKDGKPLYSDLPPKFKRLADLAQMYYVCGAVSVKKSDGAIAVVTPCILLPDTYLRDWRTIKIGAFFYCEALEEKVEVTAITGSNLVIFCDQTGGSEDSKETVAVYKDIKEVLCRVGFQSNEIELIYGEVPTQKRQAIVLQYNAGSKRCVIGNTQTLGEGLNLQGSVHPTTALFHLTLPWNEAAIAQRTGRAVRQGNVADYVDTHFIHAIGTIDQFRYFTVTKKGNIDQSLLSGDEFLIETEIPSFDRIAASLASDPVEAKARLELEYKKEVARQLKKEKEKMAAEFAKYANRLALYLKASPEWQASDVGQMTRHEFIRIADTLARKPEFQFTHLLDWQKCLDAKDADFFATDSKQILEVGSIVKDDQGRLWQISSISLVKRLVKLMGILGKGDTPYSENPAYIAGRRSAPLELSCFGATRRAKETWLATNQALFPLSGVRVYYFEKVDLSAGDIMRAKIEAVSGYSDLIKLLSLEEIKANAALIKTQLMKKRGQVLVWKSEHLECHSTDEKIDGDAIALPSDAAFHDEICRAYHIARCAAVVDYSKSDVRYELEPIVLALHPKSSDNTYVAVNEAMARGKEMCKDLLPSQSEIVAALRSHFLTSSSITVGGLIELLGCDHAIEVTWLCNLLREMKIFSSSNSHYSSIQRQSFEKAITEV